MYAVCPLLPFIGRIHKLYIYIVFNNSPLTSSLVKVALTVLMLV